jgi:hypothetical protein
MNIDVYELKSYVTVNCDIGFIPVESTYSKVGYFKVFGKYKSGSAGSSHAYHIRGMMAYAQESVLSEILDLSTTRNTRKVAITTMG